MRGLQLRPACAAAGLVPEGPARWTVQGAGDRCRKDPEATLHAGNKGRRQLWEGGVLLLLLLLLGAAIAAGGAKDRAYRAANARRRAWEDAPHAP